MAAIEKTTLIVSLRKLASDLHQVVAENRAALHSTDSIEHFVDLRGNRAGLTRLFRSVYLYKQCFSSLGVATKAELEEAWKKCYSDEDVRESVEELLIVEEDWVKFVDEVDSILQKHLRTGTRPIAVGEKVNVDLSFSEAKSGNVVSLKDYLDQFPRTLLVIMRHFG